MTAAQRGFGCGKAYRYAPEIRRNGMSQDKTLPRNNSARKFARSGNSQPATSESAHRAGNRVRLKLLTRTDGWNSAKIPPIAEPTHARGGILHAPHSLSTTAAINNGCSSSHERPTICTPMGRPSDD